MLIVVLWVLFFLAALALVIRAYLFSQLNLSIKLADRTKAYYLAKAGIKRAIWEVLFNDETPACDVLGESWSINEEVFKDVELEEGVFSVVNRFMPADNGNREIKYGLIDEERKININKVAYEVLNNFFTVAGGVDSAIASQIADSIIDWRDEDNDARKAGAEDEYYFFQDPSYPCKNAEFQSLEELIFVRGMDKDILDRIKDKLTIYGAGKVNINTADELVLRSLGMSESLVSKVLHYRAGEDGIACTKDDNIFESENTIGSNLTREEGASSGENSELSNLLAKGYFSVNSNYFGGCSVGFLKNRRSDFRKIVFVFGSDGGIKYWRED